MLFLPGQSRLKGVEDDAGEDDGWNQWYGAILATVGAGFVALSSSYWLAGAALLALPDWLPQGSKKLQKKAPDIIELHHGAQRKGAFQKVLLSNVYTISTNST